VRFLSQKLTQNHTTCRLFFPVESFVEVLFKIACKTFVNVNKKIIISLSCNTVDLTGAKNNFSLWVKPITTIVSLRSTTRYKTAVYFFENLGPRSESAKSGLTVKERENVILKHVYNIDL